MQVALWLLLLLLLLLLVAVCWICCCIAVLHDLQDCQHLAPC
jgi:hypothetical protein